MRTILVAAILAGISTVAAKAEGEDRPETKRPRPEGKGDFRTEGKDGRKREGMDEHRMPHPGASLEMFKRMDKDHDGKITKAEFLANPRFEQIPEEKRDMMFARLDRNGDEVIDREEIRAMQQDAERRAREQFRGLDVDKSGGLNFEEFSKGEFFAKLPEEKRRQIFGRMDTDGNGEINADDHPKGPPLRK